ncbi:hypothetical protein GRX03_14935 [Halovenus sp. WSH3]|uniref:Uncharacterized protein n=1 Tax=Halovenus carboxidivorans TaxID=2692199 RepID=A0A6B0TB88_9EURY|nr:hypothetical protein [Halovenus carboxidivorans]MXR52893.1 hypothetical protein [Halovenus carboxidivorans]
MSGVAFLLLVVVLGVVPLFVLYVLIEGETNDPTVVDRAEAEKIAQGRGGRRADNSTGGGSKSDDDTECGVDTGDRNR